MTLAQATTTVALGPRWLDPQVIVESLGPWALTGVCLILFAECGLLVGFFLPGDSLLFVTGLVAVSTGLSGTPLWVVCIAVSVAAFLGNACGYALGRKAGPAIFDRPNSRLFKRENVERTQRFFDKYGNRAVVLGRFVPIVRTFITVMAGVGRMDARRFLTSSAIGAAVWAAGVTLLGAALGQVAVVRDHVEGMLVLVVLVSLIPLVVEGLRARRERRVGVVGSDEQTAGDAVARDEPTRRRRP